MNIHNSMNIEDIKDIRDSNDIRETDYQDDLFELMVPQ